MNLKHLPAGESVHYSQMTKQYPVDNIVQYCRISSSISSIIHQLCHWIHPHNDFPIEMSKKLEFRRLRRLDGFIPRPVSAYYTKLQTITHRGCSNNGIRNVNKRQHRTNQKGTNLFKSIGTKRLLARILEQRIDNRSVEHQQKKQ